MDTTRIHIIAAIGRNRELGKGNRLLWNISEDLKRFKRLTTGHPIIMGRKTFESIGHALPNRTNIVVTRDSAWARDGVVVAHSLEEALEKGKKVDGETVFVIGGAEVYSAVLPLAHVLNLTLVDDVKDADVFFPPFEKEFTKKMFGEERESDGLKYTWVDFER